MPTNRHAHRDVHPHGQLRPVVVRDRSIASDIPAAEKSDRSNPDHVAAPFAGVVTVAVSVDDTVDADKRSPPSKR